MNEVPEYAKFEEPAYSSPQEEAKIDPPKEEEEISDNELPDEPYSFEHDGDGPGFDSEDDLPESDYPEVGEDHDDDSV